MKITLIEPGSPDWHVFSDFPLPRLGLPIISSILKKEGHSVNIFCEDLSPIDYKIAYSSDLIGISTTTSTAPRAYKIAREFKEMGIPVVMGGPHATFRPEEALAHSHYCVRQEGEETIKELVLALPNGCNLKDIKGLSYIEDGKFKHNPERELLCDLDCIPFPDIDGIVGKEKLRIFPIQTTRGCPFNCSFCSVTPMFGKKYRMRSIESVIDEIAYRKQKDIFFYDDNFSAVNERTKSLLEKMAKNGISPKNWTAQVRVDIAKDKDLLLLMKKTNCLFVYIGFESVNPGTLKEYKKGQTLDEIKEGIETIHKFGIRIHGMFVLGSDSDREETIRETVDFAKKYKIDTIQFLILTPLPGTKTFNELDKAGRIFTYDWSLYDGMNVVYEPKQMTPYQLQLGNIKALRKFYSLHSVIKLFLKFKPLNALLRYYGRRIRKKWEAKHKEALEKLKDFSAEILKKKRGKI
ncbi:MAG: radical SAM protein [bacterium]